MGLKRCLIHSPLAFQKLVDVDVPDFSDVLASLITEVRIVNLSFAIRSEFMRLN